MWKNQNTGGAPADGPLQPTRRPPPRESADEPDGHDEFELYDLRVEVVETGKPFVMHADPATRST
jgi:hypothetical protein